jgi:hypothetical protein
VLTALACFCIRRSRSGFGRTACGFFEIIAKDGTVTMNLPEFAGSLHPLKESLDASKTEILLTIYAYELAQFERIVDTIDISNRAKVSNLSSKAETLSHPTA